MLSVPLSTLGAVQLFYNWAATFYLFIVVCDVEQRVSLRDVPTS